MEGTKEMKTEKEIREVLTKFNEVGYKYNLPTLTDLGQGFREALKWVLQDDKKEDEVQRCGNLKK